MLASQYPIKVSKKYQATRHLISPEELLLNHLIPPSRPPPISLSPRDHPESEIYPIHPLPPLYDRYLDHPLLQTNLRCWAISDQLVKRVSPVLPDHELKISYPTIPKKQDG
jgi:hypothetical protein